MEDFGFKHQAALMLTRKIKQRIRLSDSQQWQQSTPEWMLAVSGLFIPFIHHHLPGCYILLLLLLDTLPLSREALISLFVLVRYQGCWWLWLCIYFLCIHSYLVEQYVPGISNTGQWRHPHPRQIFYDSSSVHTTQRERNMVTLDANSMTNHLFSLTSKSCSW